MSEWPPEHHVRRSRRARHISVTVSPSKGLELVLPLRATVEEGIAFLNSKRLWIEKHLSRLSIDPANSDLFPTDLCLAAIGQNWPIRYHDIQRANKVTLSNFNERLVFTGTMSDFSACLPPFNRWLRGLAHRYLPQWLEALGQETQLTFNRVSIRSQKTLWGSCSHEKNISLNDRLLFLPYALVRYVLIHELCHTVYFGHGKRFWQLVSRFDPDYKINKRSLRDVSSHIPRHFLV